MKAPATPSGKKKFFRRASTVASDAYGTEFQHVCQKYSDEVPGDTTLEQRELWLWHPARGYTREMSN